MENLSTSVKLSIKLTLEFMPLGLFFLASTEYGFWERTAVLVVATVISLALTWWLFEQLALMAIITAVTSVGAGAGTLIFDDPHYVQMKPTIVGGIFAFILLAALINGKPLFKQLLGQNLKLTEQGWYILTWLWFAYFVFITILNEYIWRNYSWEFWAAFKAFGLMPMTVVYALPQIFLLRKYQLDEEIPAAAGQEALAPSALPGPAQSPDME